MAAHDTWTLAELDTDTLHQRLRNAIDDLRADDPVLLGPTGWIVLASHALDVVELLDKRLSEGAPIPEPWAAAAAVPV